MQLSRTRRYTFGSRWYDALCAERRVHRAGRLAAIKRLGLRPGDRVGVVDLSPPRGGGLTWWPLVRWACRTGAADPHRAPWHAVESLEDVTCSSHRAGHVVTDVGTVR